MKSSKRTLVFLKKKTHVRRDNMRSSFVIMRFVRVIKNVAAIVPSQDEMLKRNGGGRCDELASTGCLKRKEISA